MVVEHFCNVGRVSVTQRIPCIIRISIFGAFSAGKRYALYTGKYGNLSAFVIKFEMKSIFTFRLHLTFEHLISCGMAAASGQLLFLKTVLNLLEKSSRYCSFDSSLLPSSRLNSKIWVKGLTFLAYSDFGQKRTGFHSKNTCKPPYLLKDTWHKRLEIHISATTLHWNVLSLILYIEQLFTWSWLLFLKCRPKCQEGLLEYFLP